MIPTETKHTQGKRRELEIRIRRLRQAIAASPSFLSELPESDADRALGAELREALAALGALPHVEPVGAWSGLTRYELARTGTCETDWN